MCIRDRATPWAMAALSGPRASPVNAAAMSRFRGGSARLARLEVSDMSRIPVAVVGATGLAGQQFLASLAGHPLFEIRKLAASSRSAGKKYADAVKDDKGASKWFCSEPLA